MSGPYDDIRHLPHPTSKKHPRMPIENRAAQFAPFAALTGYNAAIEETARCTESRIELAEDAIATLDRTLSLLAEKTSEHPKIAVTFFQEDEKKTGGAYVTISGAVKKVDNYFRTIELLEGRSIPIADILDIVMLR